MEEVASVPELWSDSQCPANTLVRFLCHRGVFWGLFMPYPLTPGQHNATRGAVPPAP